MSQDDDLIKYYEGILEESRKNTDIPYWWTTEDPPPPSENELAFIKRIEKHKNFEAFIKTAGKTPSDMNIASLRNVAAEIFAYNGWVLNNDKRLFEVMNYLSSLGIDADEYSVFSVFYFIQIANGVLDGVTGEPNEIYDIVDILSSASRLFGCVERIAIDRLSPR